MIKNRSKDFFSYNNNINVMRYSFQNNINAYLGKDSRLSLRLNAEKNEATQHQYERSVCGSYQYKSGGSSDLFP